MKNRLKKIIDEIFGEKINLDKIEGLDFKVKCTKRKAEFKVRSISSQKKNIATDQDRFFDKLEKENLIFKDFDSLRNYERLRYCYDKLTKKDLLVCGLISLDTTFFNNMTKENLRVYYKGKIDDLCLEGSRLENRPIHTLTKSEKMLIMMFYDELRDYDKLD